MRLFYHKNDIYQLNIPEYEVPVFGYKIGELKLKEGDGNHSGGSQEVLSLLGIKDYLKKNGVLACTYRGKENIDTVRFLNDLGFKFVGTYNDCCCHRNEFKEINIRSTLEVRVASINELEEILLLEDKIFDFSSFRIDPLFNSIVTAQRNVVRVKSYFANPLHRIYILKVKGKIAGFLQFIVESETGTANCVNGAIATEFQGLFIGPKLYSDAFKSVFELGISKIYGGYSNQNIAVAKLFSACNFRNIEQTILIRDYLKKEYSA